MSSQPGRIPPLQVREAATCMCSDGYECSSFAPGHALHLIQARLAAATPSDWVDAFVEAVDGDAGLIVLRTFADGLPVAVWNAAGATNVIEVGTPVALHARYHVLAAGADRFNIRVGG